MNALLNRPKKAVKDFREQHGPMETWSAEKFDRLYDLLMVANAPGPVARLRLRLTLLMWTAAAMPFYAVAELLWAAQNKVSQRLNAVMDLLDDRCSNVESACKRAGDHALVEYVGRVFDSVSQSANFVGRLAARLVRG
ncbi:hypothetical protein [Streptomyces ureilyticus]|uniref:Uncharacterized protein n=1 Tax=Streptomyces ureilyticus TaxID=1775131 RepID=A0ABX0E9V5_9ACTN|nr:hypothetical protein [Streptomyces ureilyticus]NGO48647.1 hypothetical protein [Streptomyces ureilyticus]